MSKVLIFFALLCTLTGLLVSLAGWLRARREEEEPKEPQVLPTLGVAVEEQNWARRLILELAGRFRPTSLVELEQLITRLQRAGRRNREDLDHFLENRVYFLIVCVVLGVVVFLWFKTGIGFLLMVVIMAVGVRAPDRMLNDAAKKRQDAITKHLPAAVDLMETCVEAGLAPEQAIGRVARDFAITNPVLAEEFHLTIREFEAGVALPEALRRLSRRVGLDELSALCGVMAQSYLLGAPIAKTMREYSISARRQRMMALEERAGRLASMFSLPLVLCLLPASMVAILGPTLIQLFRWFKQ